MPLALEPGEPFAIVLECDKDKSPQPRFLYRALSCREWRVAAKASAAMTDASNGADALDQLFGILQAGLLGWENMTDPQTGDKVPFNPADLDTLLIIPEAMELMEKIMEGARPDSDAKKNSDSQP